MDRIVRRRDRVKDKLVTELRLEVGGEFRNLLRTLGSNQSAYLQN
jgi:hypothetical protein